MANIQYIDPNAYIRGAQAGTEDAIRTGTAARQFRAQDLSPEVQAWYLPFVQREMAAKTGTGELALNEGLQQNAGRLTALGQPGQDYFRDLMTKLYGPQFGGMQARDPVQFSRMAGESSGLTPYGVYDPMFPFVGHYGYSKEQTLSPEQYNQTMTLKYGPNWQQQQGGQQMPSFDPWGAATGHMLPQEEELAPPQAQAPPAAPQMPAAAPRVPSAYVGGGSSGGVSTPGGNGTAMGHSDPHIYDPRPGSSGIFTGPVNMDGPNIPAGSGGSNRQATHQDALYR